VAVPVECIAKPGEYRVAFEGELSARGVREVDTRKGPATVTFSFGFIEGKDGARFKLSSKGKAMTKVALEDGKRTVLVIGDDGATSPVSVNVSAGKTALVP
jgi:hypothetical protein